MRGAWKHMRALWLVAGAAQAVLVGSGSRALRAQERDKHEGERGQHPITLAKQGSFAFGGTVLTGVLVVGEQDLGLTLVGRHVVTDLDAD